MPRLHRLAVGLVAAELRPDLMTVDPEEARPGEVITLRFPEQTQRGIGFVPEAEVEGAWELRYPLTAAEEAFCAPIEVTS